MKLLNTIVKYNWLKKYPKNNTMDKIMGLLSGYFCVDEFRRVLLTQKCVLIYLTRDVIYEIFQI